MDNALTITIIFIVLSTVIAAFIRRRKRDKCLKDFSDDKVTIAQTSGKIVHGKLRVENTGLELIYSATHQDKDGHEETSFILYKYEYPNIQTLIRYHDELSQSGKEQREEELKRTYHPGALRRLKRKILNVFKTIRDSVAEVVNLLITHAKKATPVGATLTSQDKYVSQMKQELMGSVGTSFEPLLERYIGHKVVLEMIKGDEVFEHCGVLKEYTAEFIEIMDVDYKSNPDEPPKKADMVVLRKYGLVRHLGE
ncbi:MAG: hypothetical protein ACYS1A_12245 [Planctomycetota bacterium]|jgi:hypothetical protein